MWANEQSSEMNPRTLELLCREICDKNNIEISVLQVGTPTPAHPKAPDLHREKLNMIEAVGQGSGGDSGGGEHDRQYELQAGLDSAVVRCENRIGAL